MKEKVKNILDRWDNYILGGDINNDLAEAIDTLYKADLDKRVAFEVACNPDLLEAETNYKLYENEIKQLKEIIQAQDKLINLCNAPQYHEIMRAKEIQTALVNELKKGAGL